MTNILNPIAGLSPDKMELLVQRNPLSFAQQRLWFLQQLEPHTFIYNIPFGLRLEGALDVKALERSFSEVIRRHGALRTTFPMLDGRPMQLVNPAAPLTLPVTDLTHLDVPEREAQLDDIFTEQRTKPFNLGSELPVRASLVRLGPEDHAVIIVMHHIVSDGWSVGVLTREVAALYAAYTAGRESPLEELPIQYADYAQWQREWLSGEVLEEKLSYWREQLGGVPSLLNLPSDRPRPAMQTYRGSVMHRWFADELTGQLKSLARKEGATLFMVVLGAFQVLLHRYTGQQEIMVGTSIANRNRAETEGLIGFFTNTLVLCGRMAGNPTFREFLRQVRQATLGGYDHQDVPFEKLVEELQPERSLAHAPLVQVTFVLQNTPVETMKLADLKMSLMGGTSETSQFDLTVTVEEKQGRLSCLVRYNTDLFEKETIERMVRHYERLLEGIVANPDRRIDNLSLLDHDEQQQLLVEWNDTRVPYPSDQTLHQLFQSQVGRTPDAVALEAEGQQLSYRELNGRANQLAHYLQGFGVGPEARVGIVMERSIEMVVGLLGILKAGGAYVPLDPAYPLERIGFMLEDAEVPVLLAPGRLAEQLPATWAHVVSLDADWEEISSQPDNDPPPAAAPSNLIYVIYTSGSTGKPKGVMLDHQALVARIAHLVEFYQLKEGDRQLQFMSLAFDVVAEEIFGTLVSGATLILRHNVRDLTPSELLFEGARLGTTKRNTTGSYWHQMVDELSAADKPVPESLRLMVVGGEALSTKKLLAFSRLARHPMRLLNAYGPTEATITATFYEMPLEEGGINRLGRIPIGRPLANVQVYVVDGQMQPTPVGIPGELLIGGEGLARAYLNLPALTAEHFVPNPFSSEPGARLYRTGDRARYVADGNLEFLGRGDEQVKLRGYRIELGEVEAALREHPGVREAAVLLREDDAGGEKRMVAYFVPEAGQQSGAAELRAHLSRILPEYMIPAAFVLLESLPLTPNGKLDRAALPSEQEAVEKENPYVEPRTEDEAALARIWVEVLKVERVGVRDNFFDLGGHSLLATQVISRVRDGFGVELRLQTLFELPTVETLAQAVAAGREAGGGGAQGVQAITRRSKSIEQQLAELEGASGGTAEAGAGGAGGVRHE